MCDTLHFTKDQLRAKAIKQRDFLKNSILTKDLINAAKTLKNHNDIIVRRADKSNIFVVHEQNRLHQQTRIHPQRCQ